MYVRRTSCSSCESSSCPSTILPPDAALAASAATPASRSRRNRGAHAASPVASRSRGAVVAPPAAAALSLQSALAATSAGLASRCRRGRGARAASPAASDAALTLRRGRRRGCHFVAVVGAGATRTWDTRTCYLLCGERRARVSILRRLC